jgi:cold shock CspA family protein
MTVYRYYPQQQYGFARCSQGEMFFHLSSFHDGGTGIPPLLGESVLVEGVLGPTHRRSLRAARVTRLIPPVALVGEVVSYNHNNRYGFVLTPNGDAYHLHTSEVLDGRLPLVGDRVHFYHGLREEKPRACYVRINP